MQASWTDRGSPDLHPMAVRLSMGMAGGPIEVKRPLVALKINGSRGEATCLISHVATGLVESQMMKRSDMGAPQSKTITCRAASPLRIRSKASFISLSWMREEIISSRSSRPSR